MKQYISLEEEIICDTKVSYKLKAIWNTEIDLVVRFLEVCKKHDIKFFAFAGTILGAVRHKGFIPWDDDVDFALLRSDYEKLLTVAEKEFQEPYFFQTALNDREYFFPYARLRNSETTGLITYNVSPTYNNGIYIDIFVLDGFTSDEKLFTKQIKKRDFIGRFLHDYNYDPKKYPDTIHKLFHKMIHFIAKYKPYEYWVNKYDKVLQMYNTTSTRFALMTHPKDFIRKYYADVEDLQEIIEMDFESIKIPVPKNYDRILKNMYGDYMKFPPIEQRGEWHNGVIEFDPYTPYKEYIEKKFKSQSK